MATIQPQARHPKMEIGGGIFFIIFGPILALLVGNGPRHGNNFFLNQVPLWILVVFLVACRF
ncbi:hypothetical protein AX769_22060 (plasmid) [Frondihabitans sp. PAMC 28766]|nr:hypothetical protein AX769_22060 [Frondihabitans sp. PAMC 28766]